MSAQPRTLKKAPYRSQILIVDDHPLVRERLAEIINHEKDLVVCGEAEDRHEALEIISKRRPDLVLVDLTLKSSDGLELIRDVHSRRPSLAMLVVSMHDESLYAERVLRAGARGYITKQEATRHVLQAIRRVLGGDIYLHERIATQIISRITRRPAPIGVTPAELLADRELQVFELIGRGFSTRQIATRLRIGIKTTETYRGRIREKLNLKDAGELLQMAISWAHTRG